MLVDNVATGLLLGIGSMLGTLQWGPHIYRPPPSHMAPAALHRFAIRAHTTVYAVLLALNVAVFIYAIVLAGVSRSQQSSLLPGRLAAVLGFHLAAIVYFAT